MKLSICIYLSITDFFSIYCINIYSSILLLPLGITSPSLQDILSIVERIENFVVPLSDCINNLSNIFNAVISSAVDNTKGPSHRCLGAAIEVALAMMGAGMIIIIFIKNISPRKRLIYLSFYLSIYRTI